MLKALANERRIQILGWLKEPRAFPAAGRRRLSRVRRLWSADCREARSYGADPERAYAHSDRRWPCPGKTHQELDHVQARREGDRDGRESHTRQRAKRGSTSRGLSTSSEVSLLQAIFSDRLANGDDGQYEAGCLFADLDDQDDAFGRGGNEMAAQRAEPRSGPRL